jgi:hypothetical protein
MIPNQFSIESLRSTWEAENWRSLEAGLDPSERFVLAAVQGFLAAMDEGKIDGSLPAVVFLLDEADQFHPVAGPRFQYRVGGEKIDGRVWFMSADGSQSWFLDHGMQDASDVLSAWAKEETVIRTTTVLFSPNKTDWGVTVFPTGLSVPSDRRDYAVNDLRSIDSSRVSNAAKIIYEELLRGPGGLHGSISLWASRKSPARKVPVPNAEREIQGYLRAGLLHAFPGVLPKEEVMTTAGRFDLALVSQRGAKLTKIGLLELKVVRAGDVAKEVVDPGINQARSYADAEGYPWAIVMAFDMTDKLIEDWAFLEDSAHYAAEESVGLDYWQVFSTPAKVRSYLAMKRRESRAAAS